MSTPFWQSKYHHRSFVKLGELSINKNGVRQFIIDCHRNADEITIGGVPFEKVLRHHGLSLQDLEARNSGNLDKTEIEQIDEAFLNMWRSFLPKGMSEKQQEKCIDYFTKLVHQGGVPYALSGQLALEAAKTGRHTLSESGRQTKVDLSFEGEELVITEQVDVNKMILNSDDKYNMEVAEGQRGKPLMRGRGTYSIDLTAKNDLTIKCQDIQFTHYDARVAKIFDKRSERDIFEKIVDLFNSIKEKIKSAVTNVEPSDDIGIQHPRM